MLKILKKGFLIVLVFCVVNILMVRQDRQTLGDQIIRLHVVGESNSAEDQNIKLMVRDVILEKLEPLVNKAKTKEEIQSIIGENLLMLKNAAKEFLEEIGTDSDVSITLKPEAFPTREYETFTLPAGVYDSLRVVIGEGEGKNWWCVVFPQLCIPAASEEVEDVAVSSGFSDDLGKTLIREEGYEIRFFFLDWIGKVENFFFNL